MKPHDVFIPRDLANAEGMYQAEFMRRKKIEEANQRLIEQNAALKNQLRAAAHWADLSGNKELLKVMWEALQ